MSIGALLKRIFPSTIYVKVKRNEFVVRHIESKRTCHRKSSTPFTSTRLLIGNFLVAEALLKECYREVLGSGLKISKSSTVIHPLEMTEGGLSAVEERVLLEVAYGAGADPVKVWVGEELTDTVVVEKVRDT